LVRLEVTPTLTLELDYLPQGETMPTTGFVVPRGVMARLLTEIRNSDKECSVRMEDQRRILSDELRACSDRCIERIGPIEEQINELIGTRDQLTLTLEETQQNFEIWKIGSYSIGGAMLITIIYSLIAI
tara:strand:+ start:169 stop:555 length:387 start_codon:yes stop_codon:yes gene_type:complete